MIIAGRTAPTKLMHLSAHATELWEPSWSLQHGQQGMSTLPSTDISTGFIETAAPPVAGTKAIEFAIRATIIVRTIFMRGYYRAVHAGRQQPQAWCRLAANHLALRINAVNLEYRLGDIETDCCDRLHAGLLQKVGP